MLSVITNPLKRLTLSLGLAILVLMLAVGPALAYSSFFGSKEATSMIPTSSVEKTSSESSSKKVDYYNDQAAAAKHAALVAALNSNELMELLPQYLINKLAYEVAYPGTTSISLNYVLTKAAKGYLAENGISLTTANLAVAKELVGYFVMVSISPTIISVIHIMMNECEETDAECVELATSILEQSSLVREEVARHEAADFDAFIRAEEKASETVRSAAWTAHVEYHVRGMLGVDFETTLSGSELLTRFLENTPPHINEYIYAKELLDENGQLIANFHEMTVAACSSDQFGVMDGLFGSCGLPGVSEFPQAGGDIDPSPIDFGGPNGPGTGGTPLGNHAQPYNPDTFAVAPECMGINPKNIFGPGDGENDTDTTTTTTNNQGKDEFTEAQEKQAEIRRMLKLLADIAAEVADGANSPPFKVLAESLNTIDKVVAEFKDIIHSASTIKTDKVISEVNGKVYGGKKPGTQLPTFDDEESLAQQCGKQVFDSLFGCALPDGGPGLAAELSCDFNTTNNISPLGQDIDFVAMPSDVNGGGGAGQMCSCKMPGGSASQNPECNSGNPYACKSDYQLCSESCGIQAQECEDSPQCGDFDYNGCLEDCKKDVTIDELCNSGSAPSGAMADMCGAYDPSPMEGPEPQPEGEECEPPMESDGNGGCTCPFGKTPVPGGECEPFDNPIDPNGPGGPNF